MHKQAQEVIRMKIEFLGYKYDTYVFECLDKELGYKRSSCYWDYGWETYSHEIGRGRNAKSKQSRYTYRLKLIEDLNYGLLKRVEDWCDGRTGIFDLPTYLKTYYNEYDEDSLEYIDQEVKRQLVKLDQIRRNNREFNRIIKDLKKLVKIPGQHWAEDLLATYDDEAKAMRLLEQAKELLNKKA